MNVYDRKGFELEYVELEKDETVIVDANAIVVTEGRFESINVEERKFLPLTTQTKRRLTLVGCDRINRAVVCISKPPFFSASPLDEVHDEPEKRSRVESPVPIPETRRDYSYFKIPLALVDTYGQAVLEACKKRYVSRHVRIAYRDSSLQGTVVDIKLQPVAYVGRDRSFIALILIFNVDATSFTADHVTFAAEFRKLIKDKYRNNNLSFWQRTVILTTDNLPGPSFDTLLPCNVRRFYNEQDIQAFLAA